MYSKAQFVRVGKDLPVSHERPTMVVEVEEPPTLTISSDELIAVVEKSCIVSFRMLQKIGTAIATAMLFLYKKLNSMSIRVSFEEIQETNGVPQKTPKLKSRYPGQLGLFTETAPQEFDTVSKGMPVSPTLTAKKQNDRAHLFWITFIALSFGLAASMFVR